jgi:hypothetical protein
MIRPDLLVPNTPSTGSGSQRRALETRSSEAVCALFVAALFCLAGCSMEDPRLPSLREQFVLRAEPQQPTTIAEAKSKVAESPRVEFVGRIAPDAFDFSRGKAWFWVTEVIPDEHGHGGNNHAESCPFCKHKAAEVPQAVVEFVDAAGKTLDIDARKLFDIGPGDTVVIRGTGKRMADMNDLFAVTADGIYVRRYKGGQ